MQTLQGQVNIHHSGCANGDTKQMYIFEHVTFSDMQIVVLLIIQLKLQFNHGQNVLEYRYLAHFCFISNDFDQRFLLV